MIASSASAPSVREGFAELARRFRECGFYEKKAGRVIGELAVNLALVGGGMMAFVRAEPPVVRLVAILTSTYGLVGVASNSHTSSHHATSASARLDTVLTYFGFAFVFGVSRSYWMHHHVETHHPHVNVMGVDYDADLAPWFVLNRRALESSPALARLYYRLQWLFFPVALGFNLFGIQISSWRFLADKLRDRSQRSLEHWIDLTVIILHWLAWVVVPLAFAPLPVVLELYVPRMVLVGYGMFLVAAPAHFPAEAVYLDRTSLESVDFFWHQAAATLNIEVGWFGYLLFSGADHQIEHHLFPGISHVHYRQMQPEVEAFCRRYGLPYRRIGWLSGIWKSYRTLMSPKAVGVDTAPISSTSLSDVTVA